jgi:polysaccharide chain length determinant protein (PEP-CTERM system associated)
MGRFAFLKLKSRAMRNLVLSNSLCVLAAAWRRRYLIAIPVLLMPIIGGFVGLLTPKKYETYTTILIQEAAKQNPFLKDLTVETLLGERMAALQALLHSRHILGSVAQKIGLIDKDTPGEEVTRKIAKLSSSLSAKLVGDDLVKISFESEDPSKMAEILGLVSIRFVERIVAPQRSSIVDSEKFLDAELKRRKADLEKSEQRQAEYKSKFASELPELHVSNVMRLGKLRETTAARRTELEGARASWNDLKERLFKTNPVVGKIEERIVEVLSELTVLRSRYTDSHTMVQAVLRKLNSLRDERSKTLSASRQLQDGDLERLWNMAANQIGDLQNGQQPLLISQLERLQESETRVSNLTKQLESLDAEMIQLQAKVTGFGKHERRLGELARDTSVNKKIYEDLAERHQMARLTGALGKAEEKERIKLIDPPFVPTSPSNLPLWLYLILGVVSGGAMGVGLAVLAEIMDLTIRYRRQFEKITGIPVLTRLPNLQSEGLCPQDGDAQLVFDAETAKLTTMEVHHA